MARNKCCRNIECFPPFDFFKPDKIDLKKLECVELNLDEFEAIRLADFEGLYQEKAAKKMNVSRQTFGRIVEEAHHKIAEALVLGKALKITGGRVTISEPINKMCSCCKIDKNVPINKLPKKCLECLKSNNLLINKQ